MAKRKRFTRKTVRDCWGDGIEVEAFSGGIILICRAPSYRYTVFKTRRLAQALNDAADKVDARKGKS